MNIKHALLSWFKKDTVLAIASLLAIISCFITPPSAAYIGYIDLHTLAMLFLLMLVMAGYKEIGVFHAIGRKILGIVKCKRDLILILVFLCFFSSMLITNDVALITFVPLAIMVLTMAGLEDALCFTIALMTIAANLGSMLTPLGNPQNLYLFNRSGYSLAAFVRLMLPYSLTAAAALLAVILLFCRKKIAITPAAFEASPVSRPQLLTYSLLFILCLLCVLHILDIRILFAIEVLAVLFCDRKLFRKVDYSLLLTFTAFFIFIGNMGAYAPFHDFLQNIIAGREFLTAISSSQLISNVPAALLLSGFTNHWKALIIGTNIGGLGTLIASMASLISYKQIAASHSELKTRYILIFTLWNLIFLAIYGCLFLVLKP